MADETIQATTVPASASTFETLLRRHHRSLLAYAQALAQSSDVAQDLLQEALLAAYAKLDTFDQQRDFGAWLRGFVRHKYQEWGRQHPEVLLAPAELEELDRDVLAWDPAANRAEAILAALQECLDTLPMPMRKVVDLFYFDKVDGLTLAVKLGEPEPTVRKRLQRARGRLAACVSERLAGREAKGAGS